MELSRRSIRWCSWEETEEHYSSILNKAFEWSAKMSKMWKNMKKYVEKFFGLVVKLNFATGIIWSRFKCLIIYEISWASQKIKIMFHVFQYGRGGMARNFPKSQSLYMGRGTSTTMSLRVVCLRLGFVEVTNTTSPNTRISEAYCCKFTGSVWNLYGGDKRMTPRTLLRSELRQQAVIEGRGSSTFFKSQSLYRSRAQNFSKSQSPGGSSGMEFFQVPRPI